MNACRASTRLTKEREIWYFSVPVTRLFFTTKKDCDSSRGMPRYLTNWKTSATLSSGSMAVQLSVSRLFLRDWWMDW